jgi:tetratricopeptide (TPR) repeat protein
MPLGRVEEALHEVRIAERIDPLSPNVQAKLAYVLISAGRYDEADGHCQKLPGDFPGRSTCLARARLGQGRIDEAIQVLGTAVGSDRGSQAYGYLGYAYGRAGRREEAEKLAATTSSYPWLQALTFAGLGDRDRAFAAAEQMVTLGPVRIGRDVINLPEFAFLRDDPRVKALCKKVGLPE